VTERTAVEAKALAAPARQAILAHLAAAGGPVTVAELTDLLGVNHNAVRKHLAQLVAAGLVREEHEARETPGRPRLLYRAVPRRDPYRDLAVLLATTLATGRDPADVGRAAAPVDIEAAGDGDPVDALAARFAADGFEPTVRRRGRRAEVVLGCCPFADAAAANPEVVCQLHLGLAEGAASRIGGVHIEALSPRDPRRAGCRLAVTTTLRSTSDV
jgi:predicted ArsR family transcriptional regulator